MNAVGAHRLVLDGEIVAFDDDGRPSFQRIQPRIHLASEADIRRQSQLTPVVYVIFDLLYLDGRSLLAEPYEEGRAGTVLRASDTSTDTQPFSVNLMPLPIRFSRTWRIRVGSP